MESAGNNICSHCGAELEEDALFCSECGTPLKKKEASLQNEAPEEEAPKATLPSEVVQNTPPSVQKEKDAAPVAPPQVSIPPSQKFCLYCGMTLPIEAMFCQKCGKPQAVQPQPMNTPPAPPQNATTKLGKPTLPSNINIDVEALKASFNKVSLSHILLIVSAVLALSVFLPFVSGDGSVSQKLTDISVLLSIVVLLIAAGSGYASMCGRYEVPVIAGHSLFVVFLCGIFKYQTAMKWGGFLIFLSILGLIVVGLMAALQREGRVLDPTLLTEKWKQIMLQPVKIHTLNIQGVIGAAALALVMIAVPLIGAVGGRIVGDKFEGSWCCIKPNAIPCFIKFKKLTDGKYASGDCRIYIAYDSNEHKQYLTTGEPGGIFAGFAIRKHYIYEFANEKKNTIVNTADTMQIPEARDRYYYDSDNKVLLNQTDEQYLPMDEGDEVLKKAYDTLLEYHNNHPSFKEGSPPSFEKYKDAVKRVLDEKLKEEEQYYKRQTR